MEQSVKSLNVGAAHGNFRSNKFTNDREFTKYSQHGGKRNRKNNFRNNVRPFKSDSDGTCFSNSTKEVDAAEFYRTRSHDSLTNKNLTNISVDFQCRNNFPQAGSSKDGKNFRTAAKPRRNRSKSVERQRNSPELSNPRVEYEPEVSERGNCSHWNRTSEPQQRNHSESAERLQNSFNPSNPNVDNQPGVSEPENYQNLSNEESEFPLFVPSQFRETEDACTNQLQGNQESDFPQPPCNEEIYISNPVPYYPANCQFVPVPFIPPVKYPENFSHNPNENLWDRPQYTQNGSTSPEFEQMRKPFYPYSYHYQMPGNINGLWCTPYYTSGGLFVNPQAIYGIPFGNFLYRVHAEEIK